MMIVPPLIVNEEETPVDGISKLAIEELELGGFEVPIEAVSVPPLILNEIVFTDVPLEGAKRAATFIAPPSIINEQLFPRLKELFDVPTL